MFKSPALLMLTQDNLLELNQSDPLLSVLALSSLSNTSLSKTLRRLDRYSSEPLG